MDNKEVSLMSLKERRQVLELAYELGWDVGFTSWLDRIVSVKNRDGMTWMTWDQLLDAVTK